MPQLKLKTRLHREDIKGSWTYLVLRDAFKVFGSKTNIPVKGTIDSHSIEGTLQPHSDGSHRFAVKKDVREAIGKSIGEMVEVIFENSTQLKPASEDLKKVITKNKKPDINSQSKKKKIFAFKKKL